MSKIPWADRTDFKTPLGVTYEGSADFYNQTKESIDALYTDKKTWYVSTAGNDANIGSTKAEPFRNLMAAHNAASSNEVIKILDVGFTSSSALTFTKPLIIIGPANNEHGILGATISSTLSLSTTLTLINVKFTCMVTMTSNKTIIVKNSYFNPTSLSTRLTDLEIYDSTHFVKTASQLRTLTAKGVYFEGTNLLSIGRNFELYNCVSDGSITAGIDSSSTVILKGSTIAGDLTITGNLDNINSVIVGTETVSGTTTSRQARVFDDSVEFKQNVLADKLAANVATQLNTGDFGGGVVIGSGFAGISTAPLDGMLVEGNLAVGKNTAAVKLDVNGDVLFGADAGARIRMSGGNISVDSSGTLDILENVQIASQIGNSQIILVGSAGQPGLTMTGFDGGISRINVSSGVDRVLLYENSNAGNFINVLYDGSVRIGTTTPGVPAKLDVNQLDDTAAIPTLKLTQADLSEEMIKFDATIATGNPIEAVAAKTLTPTHFIKVNIEGVGVRYIQAGTIA